MTLEQMLSLAPVVPVLVIERPEDAVPLARALVKGGLPLLEVTLRTPAALNCIARIAAEVEGAVVGAGTVRNEPALEAAVRAGARFAVSPGLSGAMVAAAGIPLLPGISTATEAMAALEAGCTFVKLFPAEAVGGVKLLRALGGPFPELTFCPTGGITADSAPAYLAEPNVACVGGAWVAPKTAIGAGDWLAIETLAGQAARLTRRGASGQSVAQ